MLNLGILNQPTSVPSTSRSVIDVVWPLSDMVGRTHYCSDTWNNRSDSDLNWLYNTEHSRRNGGGTVMLKIKRDLRSGG